VKRRLMSLVAVLVVLIGVAALGASRSATARDEIPEAFKAGELADATAELLAVGLLPSSLPQPAAIALQRVRIAPRGRIEVPVDDPKLVLFYVERGTLTVRNTVDAVVTRGATLATPGAQTQEAISAETEFIMSAGDATLSSAGSGGELRNDGTEEVILLASLIAPVPAGTPVATETPTP
jgi:redox-sensitive bicupin YhaK (pirin superfamily)